MYENWRVGQPDNFNGVEETVAFMNLVSDGFPVELGGTWYDGPFDFGEYPSSIYPLCEKPMKKEGNIDSVIILKITFFHNIHIWFFNVQNGNAMEIHAI